MSKRHSVMDMSRPLMATFLLCSSCQSVSDFFWRFFRILVTSGIRARCLPVSRTPKVPLTTKSASLMARKTRWIFSLCAARCGCLEPIEARHHQTRSPPIVDTSCSREQMISLDLRNSSLDIPSRISQTLNPCRRRMSSVPPCWYSPPAKRAPTKRPATLTRRMWLRFRAKSASIFSPCKTLPPFPNLTDQRF